MKVFLDMDGVIVDFIQGCIDHYELDITPKQVRTWNGFYKFAMVNDDTFWKGLSDEFWHNLKFTDEAPYILDFLKPYKPCILSAPARGYMDAKLEWVRRNLPKYYKSRRWLFGTRKEFCANSNAVLIDDSDEKIDNFRAAGGWGILVPRPWNSLRAMSDRGEVFGEIEFQFKQIIKFKKRSYSYD